MTFSIKRDRVKNKPASAFVVPFGTTHSEISPISEWQTGGSKLLKRARYRASIAKKDKHMDK